MELASLEGFEPPARCLEGIPLSTAWHRIGVIERNASSYHLKLPSKRAAPRIRRPEGRISDCALKERVAFACLGSFLVSSCTRVHAPLINSSTRWRQTVSLAPVWSMSCISRAGLPLLETFERLMNLRRTRGQPGRRCSATIPSPTDNDSSMAAIAFLRFAPHLGQGSPTDGFVNSLPQSSQKARTLAVIFTPRTPSEPRRRSG